MLSLFSDGISIEKRSIIIQLRCVTMMNQLIWIIARGTHKTRKKKKHWTKLRQTLLPSMETSEWCHKRDSFVVYVCDEFIVGQTRTKLLLQFFVSSSNRGMKNIVRDVLETWRGFNRNWKECLESRESKQEFVRILISCCSHKLLIRISCWSNRRIKFLILQLQLFVTTIRSHMKHVFGSVAKRIWMRSHDLTPLTLLSPTHR